MKTNQQDPLQGDPLTDMLDPLWEEPTVNKHQNLLGVDPTITQSWDPPWAHLALARGATNLGWGAGRGCGPSTTVGDPEGTLGTQ